MVYSVYGVWCTVYDVQCMVYGVQCMSVVHWYTVQRMMCNIAVYDVLYHVPVMAPRLCAATPTAGILMEMSSSPRSLAMKSIWCMSVVYECSV
jgi:hypothetical protein